MNVWKKSLCIMQIILMLILTFTSGMYMNMVKVEAKDTNRKAKLEYNILLKKTKYENMSFALVDIDQNGIDELIISTDVGGYTMNSFFEIYTYKNGEIAKMIFPEMFIENNEYEYAFRPAYNPERKAFAADPQGGSMLYMVTLQMEENQFIKKHEFSWYHEFCYYDGKQVSEQEIKKIYAEYSGEYCLKGISNTKRNRKLYLKKSKKKNGLDELNYKGDMCIFIKSAYEEKGKYYVQGKLNSIDFNNLGKSQTLIENVACELRNNTDIYVWIRTEEGDFKSIKVTPEELVRGSKDNWVFADVTSGIWYIKVKNGKLISMEQLWL